MSLDWNILLAIQRVLEWFNNTTEMLSGKLYPTLPLACPVIYSLHNYLNDRTGDATESAVKEIMLEKFEDYIVTVPDSKHVDILIRAAFLNPLVHDMLLPEHKSRAEPVLLDEVKNISKNDFKSSKCLTKCSSFTGNVPIWLVDKYYDVRGAFNEEWGRIDH